MKICTRIVRFLAKEKPHEKTEKEKILYSIINKQKLIHNNNRSLPSPLHRNILVTSALPYVNNKPHLGNIIGAVLSADVYARFARLMGYNVLYICGTDQYGTASEVKALQQKTTPAQICNQYHRIHKEVYDWFDISFDHFGRTSKDIHSTITQEIFKQVYTSGLITQKQSTQLYCHQCDLFLADRFVQGICKKCHSKTRGDQCESCSTIFNDLQHELDNLQCSVCKHKPSSRSTTHLYLKLGEQVNALKEWFSQQGTNWTNNAKGITKGWLNQEVRDRCITRDLKWGVKVPLEGFEKKVFYVWFQAPLGYISITADWLGEGYQRWWKEGGPKVELKQFMGKDNVPFHSIICPATLLATKSPWILPSQILATEYLLYQGGKFSKSHNVGVFGDQCMETDIPSECWRYYLLRIRPQAFDSAFDWQDFGQKSNKQLLNSIGNLIQRVLKFYFSKIGKNVLPLKGQDLQDAEKACLSELDAQIGKYRKQMENSQLSQGLTTILEMSFTINQYVGKTQFWKNPRQPINLAFLVRLIKLYSILFSPFMPSLTAKVNYLLGCPNLFQGGELSSVDNLTEMVLSCLQISTGFEQPVPLVKSITEDEVKRFRERFGSYKSQA